MKNIKVPTFATRAALVRAIHENGFNVSNLLSIGTDSKTVKGQKQGYFTGILYLKPSFKLCAGSKSAGCLEGCLNSAGRGAFSNVQQARVEKTRLFEENKGLFLALLISDIERGNKKYGESFVIRPNGTQDIDWINMPFSYKGINYANIFELFPMVQFYDYTKIIKRAYADNIPSNYDLTLSYSEARASYAQGVLKAAKDNVKRVAVVFSGTIPSTFQGLPVVDGDETDLRFLDDSNVIVALKAKGKAKKDSSGFVVRIPTINL